MGLNESVDDFQRRAHQWVMTHMEEILDNNMFIIDADADKHAESVMDVLLETTTPDTQDANDLENFLASIAKAGELPVGTLDLQPLPVDPIRGSFVDLSAL